MVQVLRVCNINSHKDVANIRNAISNNEGVLACQIDKTTGKVEIAYDKKFTNIEKIIESIEEYGYTVI